MDTAPASVSNNTVAIQNVYKTYDGKHWVLNGLNMTVREGTIYGLLGSSGCGKSTILNAIMGLIGLDSGTIELSIRNKCDVGFMPQSVSLYDQLTLEEQLNYYGTMYGMDADRKRSRSDLMFQVLQLPSRDLRPPQLSGGQVRRFSLAIALIHDPKLLVLDEPTVGVDPLLRESIWELLNDFVRSGGRTIIMTTHYIDEARKTNTVGLMRDGVMLCEKPPELIVEDCGTDNIEEAFFVLAQRQQQESADIVQRSPEIENKNSIYSPLSRESHVFTLSRFQEELKKNFLFNWRNLPVMLFICLVPIISLTSVYYGCGSYPEGLPLAVVNDEFPFGSQTCDSCDNQLNNCTMKYLSCGYLKKLKDTTLKFVDHDSVDEAIKHSKETKIWGVLHFPADFTHALSIRIQEPLINEDAVIDNTTVSVYLDNSQKIISDKISYDLTRSYLRFLRELLAGCNLPTKYIELPVKIEKPIFGTDELSNWYTVGVGFLCWIVLCTPVTYGGIILIEEKNCGAISRTLVTGGTYFEIFSAYTAVHLVVNVYTVISLMFAAFGVFELEFQQPLLCIILLTLVGFVGITLGVLWPVEGIHYLIMPLSVASPLGLVVPALNSLSKRGWDLSYNQVVLGFSSPLLYIIVFTTINVIYIKRYKATLFVAKTTQ